jgi:membrane fusion protein, copper/silver efflux system
MTTFGRTHRRLILVCAGAAACVAGFEACRKAPPSAIPASGAVAASAVYHCPMHPSYVSDKPGDCPICGMRLVSGDQGAASGSTATQAASGRADLTLSAERRRLLGLRSEPVRSEDLARAIRTVGRVTADERRVHHVHVKFDGYVEDLYVDFIGKFVKKGEPLLAIYSPELLATQQEYLLALNAQKQLSTSGLPQVERGGQELLEAARQRLLLWDVRAQDIAELERTGHARRTLDVHAEMSGFVLAKSVFHGMRVMPQESLFDIVDLSHVWIVADLYENDLPLVKEGMRGNARVAYLPERSWPGVVSYISPTVESDTRTVKVRLEIENPDGALKPEMFAEVELQAALGHGLTIPESALIPAGQRQIVFVDHDDGRLEPREVRVGRRVGERVELLSGVVEGERVAVSANFLLDSESSLRAALGGLGAGPMPTGHQHGQGPTPNASASGALPATPPAPPAGHHH